MPQKHRGMLNKNIRNMAVANSWGLGKHCQSLKKRVRFFHDFPEIIIEVDPISTSLIAFFTLFHAEGSVR